MSFVTVGHDDSGVSTEADAPLVKKAKRKAARDVRFGSEADIRTLIRHVRFWAETRPREAIG
jgi:hypothetical protein